MKEEQGEQEPQHQAVERGDLRQLREEQRDHRNYNTTINGEHLVGQELSS